MAKSILGRFLHLTQTKADFRFTQSGTQDSKGVSGGIYTVYSPKVDHLLTAFVSFGVAQTDLDLSVSSAAVKDSYNSLNAQAGVSLARTIQRPGLMMVWEMAAESLLSRQQKAVMPVFLSAAQPTVRKSVPAQSPIHQPFSPLNSSLICRPRKIRAAVKSSASTVCALWFRNRRFQLWLWRIG